MNRIAEYHWRGLDPLHATGLAAVTLAWAALLLVARILPDWQMILLTGAVALGTAWYWRSIMSRKRSGAWMTETHLNIYYGSKHWSFPLSGIRAVGARSAPFFARAPHLELTGGRRVQLPLTCLPMAPELRRWFTGKSIRVDAKVTLS
ncbi:hypothetical protein ACSSNL_09360 [Thalassobius sp. S69A]|uniref:hypothetical protein n=1 Tax=unclassified Thalassovita TaxID=2619711 RepID=UPI003C7BBB0F